MISASITVKVLDKWVRANDRWDYVAYVLCEIADRLFLLERKL